MGARTEGRARRRRGERGSGLIEVVLVAAVVGGLPVAAIGWQQVVRDRAADRAAQLDLRTVLAAAVAVAAEPGARGPLDAAAVAAAEPAIEVVRGLPGPAQVAVLPVGEGTALVAVSGSGRCFSVQLAPDGTVVGDPSTRRCEGISGSSPGTAPPRSPLG